MKPDEITAKQAYKAVSNYLANELGVDRNYVQAVLADKIDARNPGKLIEDAVAKYFGKGPDGWRADDVVRSAIRSTVEEHIRNVLRSGGSAYLNALLQEHLDMICGKEPGRPAAVVSPSGSLIHATAYPAAVLLHWTAADAAVAKWTERMFGKDSPVRAVVTHYPEQKDKYLVSLTKLRHVPRTALEPLSRMLDKTELQYLDFNLGSSSGVSMPSHVIARALSESDELRHLGLEVDQYVCTEKGLLCLPSPMPVETDTGKWPERRDA